MATSLTLVSFCLIVLTYRCKYKHSSHLATTSRNEHIVIQPPAANRFNMRSPGSRQQVIPVYSVENDFNPEKTLEPPPSYASLMVKEKTVNMA